MRRLRFPTMQDIPTPELRAELHRRDEAERGERRAAFQARYPCPDCGGKPVRLDTELVREHRMAPRDADGRPILYGGGEGELVGADYGQRITCVNGHETVPEEIRWSKSS